MKNIKRVLALVVVLTFVLSTAAFAATVPTSDIEDDNVKEAVERLAYFGIVAGKDDGLYHPEENLTREQFAKLVVEAMGLGDAARAASGTSGFSDVAPDRWSAGYIQVAAGKGIIKGKGDGTFAPEDVVTYPEAVTMLVRALGYKDEFLVGPWPSNYVAKAAELDIALGAEYSINGVVNRGQAAIYVNNTLDANIIKQDSFGDSNTWKESSTTLLEDKLDLTVDEDVTITATAYVDDTLDEDEVTYGGSDYTLLNQAADGLLFVTGDAYLNVDDEIVYFDVTTDEDDILTGYITDDDDANDEIKIQFADGSDNEYTYNISGIFINNRNAVADDLNAGQYGTFILNSDNEIEYACTYEIDDVVTVNSVDEDDVEIEGYKEGSDSHSIDLGDEDGYKIFLNGEVIELSDIEQYDVILAAEDINELDGDTYDYAFVTRSVVEGELTKAMSSKLYVDDESYGVDDNVTGYSLDEGDSANDYVAANLDDAFNENVNLYLDLKGEVAYLITNVDVSSSTLYGVVSKENEITMDTVKIFNSEGEEIVYTFDEDVAAVAANGVLEGAVVKFSLKKDGTIDFDEYQANILDQDDNQGVAEAGEESVVTAFDDDNDSITIDGSGLEPAGTYYVTEDTVLMSMYNDSGEVEPSLVDWEEIKGKDVPANLSAIVDIDDNGLDIDCIVFTDHYDLTGDTTVAYLTENPYYDGDWKVDVVEVDGTEATYVLANAATKDDEDKLAEGQFVLFNQTDDGEMNMISVLIEDNVYASTLSSAFDDGVGGDPDWAIETDKVATISGSVIEMTVSGNTYKVLDDAGIFTIVLDSDDEYDIIESADITDIEEDDWVQIVLDTDGDVYAVIKFDNSASDNDPVDDVTLAGADGVIYDND